MKASNTFTASAAPRGLFARIVAHFERRRYLDAVRDLRANLRPGDRATYVAEDGRQTDGLILDARYYGNGSVEAMFLADDGSTMGWKPNWAFLPIRDKMA